MNSAAHALIGNCTATRYELGHAAETHLKAAPEISSYCFGRGTNSGRSHELHRERDYCGASQNPDTSSCVSGVSNVKLCIPKIMTWFGVSSFHGHLSKTFRSMRLDGSLTFRSDGRSSCSKVTVAGTRSHHDQLILRLQTLQGEKCFRKANPYSRREISIFAAATADSDQTLPSQNGGGEKVTPTKPHPEVHPSEVVQAQLKALREKDLATVFEFASPSNKARTGPLSRFSEMLGRRAYNVMIGHVSAEILSTITISGDRFQQRIAIKGCNGNQATFLWSLSRQEEGPYEACWMTDAVRRDE